MSGCLESRLGIANGVFGVFNGYHFLGGRGGELVLGGMHMRVELGTSS